MHYCKVNFISTSSALVVLFTRRAAVQVAAPSKHSFSDFGGKESGKVPSYQFLRFRPASRSFIQALSDLIHVYSQ